MTKDEVLDILRLQLPSLLETWHFDANGQLESRCSFCSSVNWMPYRNPMQHCNDCKGLELQKFFHSELDTEAKKG